jgi:hypothetical protein
VPECNKFAPKKGRCRKHQNWRKRDISIVMHVAPPPIELLANIAVAVKVEPREDA